MPNQISQLIFNLVRQPSPEYPQSLQSERVPATYQMPVLDNRTRSRLDLDFIFNIRLEQFRQPDRAGRPSDGLTSSPPDQIVSQQPAIDPEPVAEPVTTPGSAVADQPTPVADPAPELDIFTADLADLGFNDQQIKEFERGGGADRSNWALQNGQLVVARGPSAGAPILPPR